MVNEHTETKRPKCFPDRHLNTSVFCQGLGDALRFRCITVIELKSEALRFLILSGRRVGAGKHVVGKSERGY